MKSKKSSIFVTRILTSIITLTAIHPAIAVPSKLSFSEDLITIMDLSKPAFFTLKDTVWVTAPAILPPGATVAVLEGDPKQAGPFTMRLKLPAGYEIPARWCSMDEHISVITGQLFIGMGDKLDRSKATSFQAGSFARIPLKMHHYAWTTEETVIQLHGIGPWIMGYVDPANDPIKQSIGSKEENIHNANALGVDTEPGRDADLVEELRKTGRLH